MQKWEFRPGLIALVIGILLAGPVVDPGFLNPQNLALSVQLSEVAKANEATARGHQGAARAAIKAGIDAGAVAGIENGATPEQVTGAIAEATNAPGNSPAVKSALADAQKDIAPPSDEAPGAISTNPPATLTTPPTIAPGVGYRAG
ncbi:hypothetical protein AEAC466_21450 [Asticcacaulis sp. AC466]|uniref:hypothetical protein n=1 Tax=Asticcacaulis sp. AC466 TaxID=1282362 RepID=UPI0003C409C8|nr:hypothetical protein [Asticcacaulis sp. AC466]ESQ81434.1 hypothetical protein AEAC466_21450 [Asticcacaulis sp. AC466]